MSLPRDELLTKARHPEGLAALLDLAELVLRTWQPTWSTFVDAPLREEAMERLSSLSELAWHHDGGHPGAERCRLLCHRCDQPVEGIAPIQGLLIEGNFLFDPISPNDLRSALHSMGAEPEDLGDLWVRGDRGGQGLISPTAAEHLRGRCGHLREVEIHCDVLEIGQLQLPAQRNPKRLTTVEASCRIDAIASAGFGLSRSKVVSQIKAGRLRLNWAPVRRGNRELKVGDRLQLQGRGSLELLSCTLTKRDRWRIELMRR